MSKPENPSAFPQVEGLQQGAVGRYVSTGGMTLRDYFAGQFLTMNPVVVDAGESHAEALARYVRDAYEIADEMLIARQGGND